MKNRIIFLIILLIEINKSIEYGCKLLNKENQCSNRGLCLDGGYCICEGYYYGRNCEKEPNMKIQKGISYGAYAGYSLLAWIIIIGIHGIRFFGEDD